MSQSEKNSSLVELLRSINNNLQRLSEKFDKMIELQEILLRTLKPEKSALHYKDLPLDVEALLSLPDHLRKTALTICTLGEATADTVANGTGRVRAAESDYLNQLVGRGYLKKRRKGRDVYFYIEAET